MFRQAEVVVFLKVFAIACHDDLDPASSSVRWSANGADARFM